MIIIVRLKDTFHPDLWCEKHRTNAHNFNAWQLIGALSGLNLDNSFVRYNMITIEYGSTPLGIYGQQGLIKYTHWPAQPE